MYSCAKLVCGVVSHALSLDLASKPQNYTVIYLFPQRKIMLPPELIHTRHPPTHRPTRHAL